MHDFALKKGFELEPFLGTTVINMYKKCGSLDNVVKVFGLLKTSYNVAELLQVSKFTGIEDI